MSRWSVRSRLLFINGLLLIALLIVGGIAWRALTAQSRAMADLALISKAARYHQDADTLHAGLRADVYAALAGNQSSADEREKLSLSLTDNASALRRDLVALEKIDLPPELIDTETKVRSLADVFLSKALELGSLALRDPRGAESLMGAFRVAGDDLDGAMDHQTAAIAGRITKANADAAAAENTAKRWLVAAGVITSVVVGLLVALVSHSIQQSLRRVRDVTLALAKGDLSVRIADYGTDELGELSGAINRMADHLQEVIGRLRAEADHDAFGSQLVEALEVADTEQEAYDVLARGMAAVSPTMQAELLLADSSRAHLERATQHPLAGAPGCDVTSPFSCMAVRRSTAVVFPDSEALNACSRLRGRPCGAVSAVCVPISFMGRALGVLHVTGAVGQPPDERQVAQFSTLGLQGGARIGTVRAFNSTQRKASTDSLTGLQNRRATEDRIRDLRSQGKSYAVVLADLDHFKRLNDSRGHEAGDQALRVFAETLRACLREGDLAARWGGEEFVLVLPHATAAQAAEVVERIRGHLAAALRGGGSPVFTASFGIADTGMGEAFEQLMKIADAALYAAKDSGRNCAVIGSLMDPQHPTPRHAFEHPAAPNLSVISDVA